MRSFKDRNGRDWMIDITVGAIKRVRGSELAINLYELIDNNFAGLEKLLGDPCLLVDVVFLLIEGQAISAGITATQFAESLAAESLQAMADAFVGAFVDFFPDRSQAAVLQKMYAKAKQTAALIIAENDKVIESLDAASVVENLKKKPGSPPASSA